MEGTGDHDGLAPGLLRLFNSIQAKIPCENANTATPKLVTATHVLIEEFHSKRTSAEIAVLTPMSSQLNLIARNSAIDD